MRWTLLADREITRFATQAGENFPKQLNDAKAHNTDIGKVFETIERNAK